MRGFTIAAIIFTAINVIAVIAAVYAGVFSLIGLDAAVLLALVHAIMSAIFGVGSIACIAEHGMPTRKERLSKANRKELKDKEQEILMHRKIAEMERINEIND